MKTGMTRVALALLLFACPIHATQELVWDAAAAEHLHNRAGFGATPEEIERAVARGLEATVAELLHCGSDPVEPFFEHLLRRGAAEERMDERSHEGGEGMEPSADLRREIKNQIKREDYDQLRDFLTWWIERMVSGQDRLRERMTLFWHGHFTSSMSDVKDSYEMIEQNRLLRSLALGSFRELVHAIARDPAMLEYLDNDENRRGAPNENFARELMELFTLGEGHFGEDDVKEAARAFTGWSDENGEFRFLRGRHDFGRKTVLGVSGKLDGDDVIDVLIDSKACAPFLAAKLLAYFEGVEPDAERVRVYAGALREADFEIAPVLERLFLDPAFYRQEIRAARIASPLDFLVGSSRRLGAQPPPYLLLLGANLLGERLCYPPNVKGWEGGEAWITTASLMQRGNLAGVLLGEVTLEDFLDYDPEDELDPSGMAAGMDAGMQPESEDGRRERMRRDQRALGDLRKLKELRRDWRPRMNLSGAIERDGARDDRSIVNALAGRVLAVELGAETRARLVELLRTEREQAGLTEAELLRRPWRAEPILRRLAHVVLSLPEAQIQ